MPALAVIAVFAVIVLGLLTATGSAFAQIQRSFPATALRGTLVIGQTPDILLNGRRARLAPGARIRNRDNMIDLPGSLIGQQFAVHYTMDFEGNVKDAWILTPEELAKRPWPTTPDEAARWTFDPMEQVWTRP